MLTLGDMPQVPAALLGDMPQVPAALLGDMPQVPAALQEKSEPVGIILVSMA